MKNKFMKFNQEKNKKKNGVDVKKILFLALHLGYGGAERAIISEANLLSERYDVEIACVYKLHEKPAFLLNDSVRVRYLSEKLKPNKDELKKAIRDRDIITILREGIMSLKVLWYRKSAIKKVVKHTDADVIISTRYIFHSILGKHRKLGVVTIAQEHNHHNNDELYIRRMINSVKRINYFMPVSKELTEFYANRMPRIKCLYIPHSLEYIPDKLSALTEPIMISVGRLSPEKGYLNLVDVFARISKEIPNWTLHIVGDGDERSRIEEKILEYQLTEKIIMHGYQNKEYINKLLEISSIYVMTSFSESFGIVLIEAQSYGIPCVAFDSARGALEIIDDQKNGYLIANRDMEQMSNVIVKLIKDEGLRKELGQRGRENSLQYSVENVKNKWFEFIDAI